MSPSLSAAFDPAQVEELMREVMDPELGSDIVELGMYKGVEFSDGIASVKVALTTKGCPLRAQIQNDIKQRLVSMPAVEEVKLVFTELTQEEKAKTMDLARANISKQTAETEIPANTRVLLVASGKGGVGKSTVTVNLAVGLAEAGYTVGVMDADIWGFSITRLLGLEGRLEGSLEDKKIKPHILEVGKGKGNKKAGTLKVVSMGLLVDSDETTLMWRGLVLNRAVQHFFQDVAWGEMDYLLVDMPPGTGDIQMGIAKLLPRAEMLIVTSPAQGAAKIAGRVVTMGRKNYLRIAGLVENFSGFSAPDGINYELLGSGGGEMLVKDMGVPLLGKIPIDAEVAQLGDEGKPIVTNSKGLAAKAYQDIVKEIYTTIAPPLDMQDCSARIEGIGIQKVQLGATK